MWMVVGIVVVLALIGLFVLLSPGSPGRDMRNRRDAQAGWRSGGQVSWFRDNDRRS
jgi:hypothetical protein